MNKTKPYRHVENELVSEKDLAQRWGVDRRTVVRLLEEGGVYPYYLSGKQRGTKRYAKTEVEAFMARSKAAVISRS